MMWRGWERALGDVLAEGLPAQHDEELSLDDQEGKSMLGNWAVPVLGGGGERGLGLATYVPLPCTFIAPRDALAFALASEGRRLMEAERWLDAMAPLSRLVGLRPHSFSPFFKAGVCGTLGAPKGQLRGRAGRKCVLEDAERFLNRAIELAPGWPPSYAMLARNLVEMGRGREDEVPAVIVRMLQVAGLETLCARYPEAADAVVSGVKVAKEVLIAQQQEESIAGLWARAKEVVPSLVTRL